MKGPSTTIIDGKTVIELEEGWNFIQKGITKLQNLLEGVPEKQFNADEYIMLYTTIYTMCSQCPDYRQQLYDRYRKSFEDYISTMVLSALCQKHDEFMLKELVKRRDDNKIMVRWMLCFFGFLDRYLPVGMQLALNEVGLMCFRDRVYVEMKNNVKDAIITLIDREREGEEVDRALLKNVLELFFVERGMGILDVYENDFELAMLTDTAAYYSKKAACWIEEDSCSDYMLKAEECLKREKERAGHYLHLSSEPKLLEKVYHELIFQYQNQLLGKALSGYQALLRDGKLEDFLRNGKLEDLSRQCRLIWKIPNYLELAATIFQQQVTDEVTALVNQAKDAISNKKRIRAEKKGTQGGPEQALVRKVIDLHDRYLQYVSDCFTKPSLFQKALKEAFEVFCNKSITGNTSVELLATFGDNLLKRGGSGKLTDERIEDTFEKIIKLLVYIHDRDLFAEFFRRKLARRLLFDESVNGDHQKNMWTKLKQRCGGQFTSRMEGMVTDLTLAREIQTSFKHYQDEKWMSNPSIDLNVTVLTTRFWPSYKASDIALPAEMVKCVEEFNEFYQAKRERRKLTWIYSLGTCIITGTFDAKPIDLIVTTFQAAVLLLFNTEERRSYADIKGQLNLTDEDIVRLLHSLSCAKHKILNKDPGTDVVNPGDSFEFNTKFTDKMGRIKIPLPPMDENMKVIAHVDEDRRYAIDASIVRIMKFRKVLPRQQLALECVEELGQMFKPDLKAIKIRIEDLIAREYLERDKDNLNMFRYLA